MYSSSAAETYAMSMAMAYGSNGKNKTLARWETDKIHSIIIQKTRFGWKVDNFSEWLAGILGWNKATNSGTKIVDRHMHITPRNSLLTRKDEDKEEMYMIQWIGWDKVSVKKIITIFNDTCSLFSISFGLSDQWPTERTLGDWEHIYMLDADWGAKGGVGQSRNCGTERRSWMQNKCDASKND